MPVYEKWFDFGSPQHKKKQYGTAVSVENVTGTDGNRMGLHGKQNLSSTIRTRKIQALGGTNDTVNTLKLADRAATQHGIRINRPNAVHDFKMTDIVISHAPIV